MNIFQVGVNKYKEIKQRSLNRKEFNSTLLDAVKNGSLSDAKIKELNKKGTKFKLTHNDLRPMRIDVFRAAYEAIIADGKVTEHDQKQLENIQKYLHITDDEVAEEKKEIERLKILTDYRNGLVPPVTTKEVILWKNEKVLWIESVEFAEERISSRKSVTVDHLLGDRTTKTLEVRRNSYIEDEGKFIITSKRLIFKGSRKSFFIINKNLMAKEIYQNAVFLFENNKQPRKLFFNSENYEIIEAILEYVIKV